MQYCKYCKQWKHFTKMKPNETDMCNKCYPIVYKDKLPAWRATNSRNRRARHIKEYTDWLNLIKQIPKDAHPLTENEWMEACRYFNGCAWCGTDNIDSRGFFVSFSEGGRYCNWNIIPTCARCATRLRLQQNPWIFTRTMKQPEASKETTRYGRLYNIVDYLGGKIDEIIQSGNSTEGSTEGDAYNCTERTGDECAPDAASRDS